MMIEEGGRNSDTPRALSQGHNCTLPEESHSFIHCSLIELLSEEKPSCHAVDMGGEGKKAKINNNDNVYKYVR